MKNYLVITLFVIGLYNIFASTRTANNSESIIINEFLAGSDNCCGSEIFNGNNEDFVELYNAGQEVVSLYRWGFSDTDGLITTIAPDTVILPGEFLVLWFTGDNNGFPEINEKLSKNGETIYIADSVGNTIISFDFESQTDDISYGRNPDGSDTWQYFQTPSPGASNVDPLSVFTNEIYAHSFKLNQNYPNPFNLNTVLSYELMRGGKVELNVFDVVGRKIKTLVNAYQNAGWQFVPWNATNNRNEVVPSGLYVYVIQKDNVIQTKKMLLMK